MKAKLIPQMQSYVAETCVGATAIRNQGGSGLVQAARDLFKEIDLSMLPVTDSQMQSWLNDYTKRLLLRFPKEARNFGAARKALNLFLRSAAYNVYLNRAFKLNARMFLLEVPVDSYTAKHLLVFRPSLARKWVGLKALTPEDHRKYQNAALELANQMRVHRVDLDVFFYRMEPVSA